MSVAAPVSAVIGSIKRDILSKSEFRPQQSDRLFTISTSYIGALIFVLPFLRRLGIEAPKSDLRCVSLTHQQIEEALEQGKVGLAVGYFPDLSGSNMESQDLFDYPFTCIVRRNAHLLTTMFL
jgi:DNA-binding transcriptional LysR family regulator